MKKNSILNRIIRFLLLVLILGIVAHFCFANHDIYWQDFGFVSMSTWVKARFYVKDKQSVASAARILQKAFRDINQICSVYDPHSELNLLNANAFREPVPCSKPLWNILMEARKISKLSNGAFDITVNPLQNLWGRQRQIKQLPSPEDIAKTKEKIGMDKVIFDDQAHTIRFTVDGMSLNLGAIAKGMALDYAAERIVHVELVGVENAREVTPLERLEARFLNRYVHLNCGYIDAGGNVIVLPEPPPDKQEYRAGVKNPFQKNGKPCAYARMLNESISTSGSYERFTTINGKKYSHIIDPISGLPVENMLSVSVIAKSGVLADALSTAIFVGGKPVAEAAMKEYPELRILMYYINPETKAVEVWQTGQWEDVEIPEITQDLMEEAAPSTVSPPVMKTTEPQPSAAKNAEKR